MVLVQLLVDEQTKCVVLLRTGFEYHHHLPHSDVAVHAAEIGCITQLRQSMAGNHDTPVVVNPCLYAGRETAAPSARASGAVKVIGSRTAKSAIRRCILKLQNDDDGTEPPSFLLEQPTDRIKLDLTKLPRKTSLAGFSKNWPEQSYFVFPLKTRRVHGRKRCKAIVHSGGGLIDVRPQ